ncbi:hypothetical protein Syun_008521 [Stephania yunnanensis]|uniref:Uncharacterized protein n=1 Tax=Stephania yunnanensis TaxID=152371 RepID=A0AAP0KFD4_9MAGN
MELFREEEGSNDEACFCIGKPKDEDEEVTKEYKTLISDQGLSLDHWILKKSRRDLKRWIKMSSTKVPNHLIELLRQTPPSQESLATLLKDQRERCSISILVLERLASVFVPSSRSECIFNSLGEVFEVLFYIDQRMSYPCIKEKSRDAKDLWTSEGFKRMFQKLSSKVVLSQMQIDQAIETIKSFKDILMGIGGLDIMVQELDAILGFIQQKAYTSIENFQNNLYAAF